MSGRRRLLVALVALVVGGLVATAAVVWPRLQEHREAEQLARVEKDAHRLRSAILRVYPRVDDLELRQEGRVVTLAKPGRELRTIELAEGDRVVDWTPPPFRRSGWPFAFCIEHVDGAWAYYHSHDGVVRRTGTDGRCAVPDIPGVNARYRCPEPSWRVRDLRNGQRAVVVRWGLENANDDNTRWVDVYDGVRRFARIDPWKYRQYLVRLDPGEGFDRDLTFVATNGIAGFDSVDCPATSIAVPGKAS